MMEKNEINNLKEIVVKDMTGFVVLRSSKNDIAEIVIPSDNNRVKITFKNGVTQYFINHSIEITVIPNAD